MKGRDDCWAVLMPSSLSQEVERRKENKFQLNSAYTSSAIEEQMYQWMAEVNLACTAISESTMDYTHA